MIVLNQNLAMLCTEAAFFFVFFCFLVGVVSDCKTCAEASRILKPSCMKSPLLVQIACSSSGGHGSSVKVSLRVHLRTPQACEMLWWACLIKATFHT